MKRKINTYKPKGNLILKTEQSLFRLFMLLPLLGFSMLTKAQNNQKDLYMIARPLKDSIILRWAPSNYETWDLGNKYGYNIVRLTILRDSLLLEKPEEKFLTTNALKPMVLSDWEPLVKSNRYAAIAAQAIFGETFKIEVGEGFIPENVTLLAREQQQRFSFALYSADMSPVVACASGLWISDKEAHKNEKYLYRVILNLPDSIENKVDTGFVFTGISEYAPLPKPIELSVEVKDKSARIGWNVFAQNNIYMAWELERSANKGKSFESITNEPIVSLTSKERPAEFAYKFDSLPEFNKEFYYRLRGISSFGEKGPWSEAVKATAIELINGSPIINGYEQIDEHVVINWEIPKEEEAKTNNYKILRADNANNGFISIADNIKSVQRKFTDKQPISTAYYKVVSVGDGNEKESPAYLVQMSDNTPPEPPSGFIGKADSLGKIHLSWQANTEADILGYMVFKSASGKDEFTLLSNKPVLEAHYIDSVASNDLNKGVYYRLMAVDHRYNQSAFSNILFINKVDLLAPSVPVLITCKVVETGIEFSWINSASSDVVKHVVMRFLEGDSTWTQLSEIENKKYTELSSYIDREASSEKIGRYRIVAVDQAGNTSEPAQSIDIKAQNLPEIEKVRKVRSTVDMGNGRILLTWEAPEKRVKQYKIYRKTKDVRYTNYETLNGDNSSFEDYGMKAGNFYAYRIKVIYEDGTISGFSDEIRIDF